MILSTDGQTDKVKPVYNFIEAGAIIVFFQDDPKLVLSRQNHCH